MENSKLVGTHEFDFRMERDDCVIEGSIEIKGSLEYAFDKRENLLRQFKRLGWDIADSEDPARWQGPKEPEVYHQMMEQAFKLAEEERKHGNE